MRTVFILGAGASAAAGVPMMAEFLDVADRLFRGANDQAATDVFRAISELQGVYAKSFLDLDNIEALFGAIEMARLVGKLGSRKPGEIETLRANLVSLVVRTIERTTHFPVRERSVEPARPYGPFGKLISDLMSTENRARGSSVSCLTFNYDVTLDHALMYYRIPIDYGLGDALSGDSVPLLKLHGSISWGHCEKCRAIVPWDFGANVPYIRPGGTRFTYNLGSRIHELLKHCGEPVIAAPVLVPPTWNKNDYHGGLARVWQRAAVELGDAENIFVIGYSLPESDSFFRYLFALGSASETRLKRLWVVNPDSDGQVARRFETMVGRGIRNRLRFVNGEAGEFERAIPGIRAEIEQELK